MINNEIEGTYILKGTKLIRRFKNQILTINSGFFDNMSTIYSKTISKLILHL